MRFVGETTAALRHRRWGLVTAVALALMPLGALGACTSFDAAEASAQDAGTQREAAVDIPDVVSETDAGSDAIADGPPSDGSIDAPPTHPDCPLGTSYRGSFATWLGKVNVHTLPDGGWTHDPDCESGANINDLVYCKKWWEDATSIVLADVDPTLKPFWNAGCEMLEQFPGEQQFVCCGL